MGWGRFRTADPCVCVPFHLPAAQWIGLAVLFLVGWLIYRTGKYAKA